ncbi:uncharacterized protein BCR38DRAFT_342951 [Pseudomassariella vexata]|uniref:Prolyl 4-hydroxylase alpha subunit domain-containing protein n=1 Tax=Pseudomassariella vexata TaxID=1141098 RepID=A0A1Y2DX96_9PEZI|nr:uncharacterized protein BCR38DRAFT_342951 [Pseudomassariella vexata]ORY63920.1 hypothetical protein BCR38DRAFT_342951 [Pseudomassariella vexata]
MAALALSVPYLYHLATSPNQSLSDILLSIFHNSPFAASTDPLPFTCTPHNYTTEIISLSPLLVYIHSFLAPHEITSLLAAGEPEFQPSEVVKNGRKQGTGDRTSSSAGLPRDNPAVQCVLDRAQSFMGTMLSARDEIGPPQLVRYTAGQRYNVHHDWYERPQPARRENMHRGRSWNRVASFFAILEDGCTEGETYFPYVKTVAPQKGMNGRGKGAVWREHEDGGLAFRPVKGNSLFWVNLHANGTGDTMTMHAGLPLGEGLKTAMNIWPRHYYP